METRALERELRWAGAVAAPFLMLAAILAVYGVAQRLLGPLGASRIGAALEVCVWLAVVTSLPAAGVVLLVLVRAGWRGRFFASKGDRLVFHALASLAASGGLVGACDGAGAVSFPNALAGSLALSLAVFPLVYWPRLLAPLSGLEPPAGLASPASLRS